MSGGVAYVLDEAGDFPTRCNTEMVDLEPLEDPEDIRELHDMIQRHVEYTGSARAPRAGALGRIWCPSS
jgi:glutamate synthase domain-containing protein 3